MTAASYQQDILALGLEDITQPLLNLCGQAGKLLSALHLMLPGYNTNYLMPK